jgi:GntR family transcriptional regulator
MFTAHLNPKSKVPLYYQLYTLLRHEIQCGEWKAHDMIPPESEMVERYGLSRTTIRQVLGMLADEGLIYKQKGRGTFVAPSTLEQGLTHIVNFTQDMVQRGLEPGTEVLFSGLMPASQDIAEKLRMQPGEELACLERLRLANSEPMSVEESYLVHHYCPGVLNYDYTRTSLRELMDRQYNIHWTYAKQTIRAVSASTKLARLLAVSPGAPLLYIERISFSQQDIPVEFLRIYYRGDRYSLYGELRG